MEFTFNLVFAYFRLLQKTIVDVQLETRSRQRKRNHEGRVELQTGDLTIRLNVDRLTSFVADQLYRESDESKKKGESGGKGWSGKQDNKGGGGMLIPWP